MPIKVSNVQKGLEIADRYPDLDHDDLVWVVPDAPGSKRRQRVVTGDPVTCTCRTFKSSEDCKHFWAVYIAFNRALGEAGDLDDLPVPVFRHPPIWPETGDASPKFDPLPIPTAAERKQTSEREADRQASLLLRRLLFEVCKTVEPPKPSPKGGHPSHPFRDMLYAVLLKGIKPVSDEKLVVELANAERDGYIASVPLISVVNRYMGKKSIGHALRELVRLTAEPAKGIDREFGIDSTQFTFGKLRKTKEGQKSHPPKARIKVHLVMGLDSRIFTAVRVTYVVGHHDDGKYLPLLVGQTKDEGFSVRSVAGDNAYCRERNFAYLDPLGVIPFLEFQMDKSRQGKRKATGLHSGPFFLNWFEKMQRDPYLYRDGVERRNRIEAHFKSKKATFDRHVMAKAPRSICNEARCKVVCYNIYWTVRKIYEYGEIAKPSYWPD